jgi:hypothetical protein
MKNEGRRVVSDERGMEGKKEGRGEGIDERRKREVKERTESEKWGRSVVMN